MKKIPFAKYHGTANDFIIINHMIDQVIDPEDHNLIKEMCSRRFGIGADGLMILEKGNDVDFNMRYYNADGSPSSMCGNGGRCISLAYKLQNKGTQAKMNFTFGGDLYQSEWLPEKEWISLKMQDLSLISKDNQAYVLDSGSPHYVDFVKDSSLLDVAKIGAEIRYNSRYKKHGINVNYCHYFADRLHVRTYERGVEDETYSCGTGVVASSIAWSEEQGFVEGTHTVSIKTLGGNLAVQFTKTAKGYVDIYLQGPAVKVFEAEYHQLD